MNKINQTLRYLSKGFVVMTVFGFLAILVNAAITDLVFFLTDRYNSVHLVVTLTAPLEFAAGLFALMSGLMLFLVNFKVVLANGISRKTFLLANLPIAALAAAALSIFNLLFVQLHRLFCPIILSSELIYPHTGWAGLLILQFTLYFLLIISGWFINLAYYRSTKPFKWLIPLRHIYFLAYCKLQTPDSAVLYLRQSENI